MTNELKSAKSKSKLETLKTVVEDDSLYNEITKKLFRLRNEKTKVIQSYQSIMDNFVKEMPKELDDDWLAGLSLGTVKDFLAYEAGNKKIFGLTLIDKRTELRKEKDTSDDKISAMDSQMRELRADLLLDRVKKLEEKLSS